MVQKVADAAFGQLPSGRVSSEHVSSSWPILTRYPFVLIGRAGSSDSLLRPQAGGSKHGAYLLTGKYTGITLVDSPYKRKIVIIQMSRAHHSHICLNLYPATNKRIPLRFLLECVGQCRTPYTANGGVSRQNWGFLPPKLITAKIKSLLTPPNTPPKGL